MQQKVSKNIEQLQLLPKQHICLWQKQVKHDGRNVLWIRTQKEADLNLEGEHCSLTYDVDDGKLMGLMRMSQFFTSEDLPSEETAKKVCFDFLKQYAADIADKVEVRWIKPLLKKPLDPPHDEGFALGNGDIVVGVRVKLWDPSTQKYAWVIVGKDQQVVSFERDIVWDSSKHCRSTERWLHDTWLKEQRVAIN